VTRASLEKWRAELGPLEVAAIEDGAGAAMAELGYALASTRGARARARAGAAAATALDRAEQGARGAWRRLRGRPAPTPV
jgi:hypothetical protein